MKILVTGSAGFIGNALALRLLERGDEVVGVDNLNDYYDVRLKEARLARIASHPGFTDLRVDLSDRAAMASVFAQHRPRRAVNLAAQAGVRYSLDNPQVYVEGNLVGFGNVLEGCRQYGVEHLVYASSSSVYGANTRLPLSVGDRVDHPKSLYAATKKANELMAHTYSSLFGLPTTGLRFFTVYGPWGRPDMALFKFTRAILAGEPIDIYNHGRHRRDFTYIDDVVECILRFLDRLPQPDPDWKGDSPRADTSYAPYRLYNVGNGRPVQLLDYIESLEACLGRRAIKNFLPLQAGDVFETHADVSALVAEIGFAPSYSTQEGIRRFVEWYLEYTGATAVSCGVR